MANNSYWTAQVGINHAPAYQVSGRPYASGDVDASDAVAVNFPYVTRWVKIINKNAFPMRVGFSEKGVSGSVSSDVDGPTKAYFTIPASGSMGSGLLGRYGESEVLEMKVSQIWLWPGAGKNASAGVDVVAGLTTIPCNRTNMDPSSGSDVKVNWSGSNGVG